ncbi:MAG: hypothetical protein JKY60_19635 [Kordiimonadaceae bacterium]|nr:hypothetical protein [Kordiimonadaceae bacterium]
MSMKKAIRQLSGVGFGDVDIIECVLKYQLSLTGRDVTEAGLSQSFFDQDDIQTFLGSTGYLIKRSCLSPQRLYISS